MIEPPPLRSPSSRGETNTDPPRAHEGEIPSATGERIPSRKRALFELSFVFGLFAFTWDQFRLVRGEVALFPGEVVLALGPYLVLSMTEFRRLTDVGKLLTVVGCAFFLTAFVAVLLPTWQGVPAIEVTERTFANVSALELGVPWIALALGPAHLAVAKIGADLLKGRVPGRPGAVIAFLYLALVGAVGTLTVVGYGTGSASLLP